ncbi:MAG: hypothetical protein LUE96_03315 [Lachnospiraceae bacterium]|nr:hypothetical protein [Lachnospiraceae bacterium]
MEFFDGKGAARFVSEYIEREMQEFKKSAEGESCRTGVAPEAREAFYRKPYYGIAGAGLKCRPVLR